MPERDQRKGTPGLSPLKIGQGEFLRSNVFISWSPKLDREIRLIGPSAFDAWLTIEFDPDIVDFCERPPLNLRLSQNDDKIRRLDFWIHRRSGIQTGVILHDPTLSRDASLPIELLQRAIERSELNCVVWHVADLRQRRIYLRNLKHLLPFLSNASAVEAWVIEVMKNHLERFGQASWLDLVSLVPTQAAYTANTAVAWLIHRGYAAGDLGEQLLTNSTHLRWA